MTEETLTKNAFESRFYCFVAAGILAGILGTHGLHHTYRLNDNTSIAKAQKHTHDEHLK